MYHVASERVQLAIPGAGRKIDGCADGVGYLVINPLFTNFVHWRHPRLVNTAAPLDISRQGLLSTRIVL